ncbi:MAG TPA: ECF-type sigma factor [Blastocatellia bacterium]|nr:ECF-type sigma factor [Blastocatellia bacterium]
MNTPSTEDEKQSSPEDRERLSSGEVTQLLLDWNNGDASARDRLAPLVYDEMRRMAHRRLLGERAGHTLQTGALVNEVYLRLFGDSKAPGRNRIEFFGIVARQMRRVLVDAARKRNVIKRGGNQRHVPLEDVALVVDALDLDLVALGEALDALEQCDEELSQVIELHYFAEFTIEETAEILGASINTVKRRLKKARIYLYDELTRTKGASDGSSAVERD